MFFSLYFVSIYYELFFQYSLYFFHIFLMFLHQTTFLKIYISLYLLLYKSKEPPEKRWENHRLLVTASFAFCIITFEPIEVQTCSAPQNDCLNLSFVKDMYIVENWLEMVEKRPFIILWVSQVQKNIFAFCVITFEQIMI